VRIGEAVGSLATDQQAPSDTRCVISAAGV